MTQMYCHLFMAHGVHIRVIRCSFQYMQKSATFAAKSFKLLGVRP